jgi:hypothetical protein
LGDHENLVRLSPVPIAISIRGRSDARNQKPVLFRDEVLGQAPPFVQMVHHNFQRSVLIQISQSRSPTAEPRETHGSVIPAPALADQSLNRPPPTFQYWSLGWRYL